MAIPTAEMPMPGGLEQRRLISALEDHDSLYELALELPILAKSLRDDGAMRANNFSVAKTVANIESDQTRGWKMLHLLYSMDRSVIRSIIRNTVAYDTFNSQVKWLQMPSPTEGKVPGVYVIGLGRDDGKFLCIDEMLKLANGIEDYIAGYFEIKRYHQTQAQLQGGAVLLNARQQALIDWVNKVDRGSIATRPIPDSAQYIKQDSEIPKLRALTAGYLERCKNAFNPKTRQIQSPLYVGCSVDLRKRTDKYSRDGLIDMNKPMGLTVQVLEALGIPVKLYIQVAIRIWELDQLPLAEQLIATLAGSLIYRYGFNAIEAGGTGSKSIKGDDSRTALNRSRDLVMLHSDSMLENMRAMAEEISRRTDFAQALRDINAASGVIADLEAGTAGISNLTLDTNVPFEDLDKVVEQKKKKLNATLEDLRLVERHHEAVYELSRRRWPEAAARLDAMSLDDGSPDHA